MGSEQSDGRSNGEAASSPDPEGYVSGIRRRFQMAGLKEAVNEAWRLLRTVTPTTHTSNIHTHYITAIRQTTTHLNIPHPPGTPTNTIAELSGPTSMGHTHTHTHYTDATTQYTQLWVYIT